MLCFAQLLARPVAAHAQQPSGQLRHRSSGIPSIAEPPELKGEPPPIPPTPSAASLRFVESKAIREADPHNPKTVAPAIRELDELIQLEPNNSDFYFLRANLSCYDSRNPMKILEDVAHSISLYKRSNSTADSTLKQHLAFKAKIEFEMGHLQDSMSDLDAAIKEDYQGAEDVFNDGNVKPTTIGNPCIWTQSDLETLEKQFSTDYRPPLYRGLYLNFFLRFDAESDRKDVIAAFERSATLTDTGLPHFFIGKVYTQALGGFMSMQNAKCLDWVTPRTQECIALDETLRRGVRSLTRAMARDPNFSPTYEVRAEAFLRLKEYRQAIRDFDKVLELNSSGERARIAYNDRGIAEESLGQHQAAVLDFTKSIAIGCKESCGSYDNRADAFLKLKNYPKAIDDISKSIEKSLASYAVFSMNIDQFRRVYPEYDSVPDDVLCEKLRALFYPSMKYTDFAERFLVQAHEFTSSVLPELYLKRGDAYAAMGHKVKANLEYDRVSRGFPDWAAASFTEENGKRIRKTE